MCLKCECVSNRVEYIEYMYVSSMCLAFRGIRVVYSIVIYCKFKNLSAGFWYSDVSYIVKRHPTNEIGM